MITILPWSGNPTIKPPPGGKVIGAGVPAGEVAIGTGTIVPTSSAVPAATTRAVGSSGIRLGWTGVGVFPAVLPDMPPQPDKAKTIMNAKRRYRLFFIFIPTFTVHFTFDD
jgi:hypothetical protein